jgi:hypothetical protein
LAARHEGQRPSEVEGLPLVVLSSQIEPCKASSDLAILARLFVPPRSFRILHQLHQLHQLQDSLTTESIAVRMEGWPTQQLARLRREPRRVRALTQINGDEPDSAGDLELLSAYTTEQRPSPLPLPFLLAFQTHVHVVLPPACSICHPLAALQLRGFQQLS